MTIAHILTTARLLPVLTIHHVDDAVPMVTALTQGGVTVVEITLRTEAALAAITRIKEALPHLQVGAGTVKNPEQLRAVMDSGADFAVSPGSTPALAEVTRKSQFPFLHGTATPSDILFLYEQGFRAVKFFPAEINGGVRFLQSVYPLFPDLQFCPTGGVNLDNAQAYINCPNVPCIGGTWLVPAEAVQAKNWEAITALAKAALAKIAP